MLNQLCQIHYDVLYKQLKLLTSLGVEVSSHQVFYVGIIWLTLPGSVQN